MNKKVNEPAKKAAKPVKKVAKPVKKAAAKVVKKQEPVHDERASLISLLNSARLPNPFEQLGLLKNPKGKGFIIRAWLPGAQKVELYALSETTAQAEFKQTDASGLFEVELPTLTEKFIYELNAIYETGNHRFVDPYQFHDIAFDGLSTLHEAPQNVYKTLGAQLKTTYVGDHAISGVRFIVYAPNATSVSLITEFNHWDGRRQPMQRSWCGHWVIFVPDL
ncbi:MAG: 1,4-alpha-glucan branching enzyme, partial [Psychromonas sp.]